MWDRRAAQRIALGDKAAGERWVMAEYAPIYRMLAALCGSADTAADLTQQTFAHAWSALGDYRGEASLRTWLRRIAYHEYTHWLRDRRPTLPLDSAALVVDTGANSDLTTVVVTDAMHALPEELRAAFICFYIDGMSIREIAELTGSPIGTVKARLFTARTKLRAALAPPDVSPEPIPLRETG